MRIKRETDDPSNYAENFKAQKGELSSKDVLNHDEMKDIRTMYAVESGITTF